MGIVPRTIPFSSLNWSVMEYRCEVTTVVGFVQQVAVQYVRHGYWFYVPGMVPERKDPRGIDRKLIAKYGIGVSQKERCRRKRAGLANMQYIRHGQFFLLLATHGRGDFFSEEAGQIRDARRTPIKYAGYAIAHRNGRVCVRIDQMTFEGLKAYFVDLACRRSANSLAGEFASIRFVPYAPIRQQLLAIWRAVNRARSATGYEHLPIGCVPWRRPIVKPFEYAAWPSVERPA